MDNKELVIKALNVISFQPIYIGEHEIDVNGNYYFFIGENVLSLKMSKEDFEDLYNSLRNYFDKEIRKPDSVFLVKNLELIKNDGVHALPQIVLGYNYTKNVIWIVKGFNVLYESNYRSTH